MATQNFRTYENSMLAHDIEELGCFESHNDKKVQLLDAKLLPNLSRRDFKIQRCAEVAFRNGIQVFGLYDEGECAEVQNVELWQISTNCPGGIGSVHRTSVYKFKSTPL